MAPTSDLRGTVLLFGSSAKRMRRRSPAYITDQSGAVVAGAAITLTNVETNINAAQSSNGSGLYVFTNVKPGRYRIVVQKPRFRQIALTDMTVNVQDLLSRNFRMQVGAVGESITVNGDIAYINTVSGTVSTVVDQQFVDNMPLNGRSFQSLIALTPGVVSIATDNSNNQFVVNGQRPDANYFMVDGVSANFGIAPAYTIAQTLGGTTPGFTAAGGTNGMVSVDAMQEFRIQTLDLRARIRAQPRSPALDRDQIRYESISRIGVRLSAQR